MSLYYLFTQCIILLGLNNMKLYIQSCQLSPFRRVTHAFRMFSNALTPHIQFLKPPKKSDFGPRRVCSLSNTPTVDGEKERICNPIRCRRRVPSFLTQRLTGDFSRRFKISKIKKKKYLKYTSQKVTQTPFFNKILCKNSKNRTSNSKCNSNNHNIQ